MGRAILKGFLRATQTPNPPVLQCEASVANIASAQRLQTEFESHKEWVKFVCNDNLQVARNADVVLLCFPPSQVQPILSEPGMGDAVQGKLIISILAGVARRQIEDQLYKSAAEKLKFEKRRANIIRVMPTLGAQAYESATLIVAEEPPLPSQLTELTERLFKHIGETYVTPSHLFDSLTALTAVCHGLMVVAVDALVDGS